MESDVTGRHSVMTSGTQQLKGKKRGRKRKTEEVSVISGGNVVAADVVSAAGQLAEEAEEDDDDADENEGVFGDQDKQQKRKEKADLAYVVPSDLDFLRHLMDFARAKHCLTDS